MYKGLLVVFYGLIISSLIGCSEVDSEDIRTSGFNVDASVMTTDGLARVVVRLKTGDNLDSDDIVLTGPDRLFADLSGRRIELPRSNDAYRTTYDQVAGGEVLTLALLRPDGVSAIDSQVLLPNTFDLITPRGGAMFNAGGTITVTWSPVDTRNPMTVRYSVDCSLIENSDSFHGGNLGRSFEVADTGTHSVPVNTILNAFDDQEQIARDITCPLKISLTRENRGILDSAFDGGSIEAKHVQSVFGRVIP